MSLQRYSEPRALQLVWKAIEVIRGQRQIANISRITKVIQREHSFSAKEIMHHILKAVRDSMVIETLSVGCKGSKAGMEQEGYWIPEDTDILDVASVHDFYCFQCHRPGLLTRCNTCFRAYHLGCIESAYRTSDCGLRQDKKFKCKTCTLTSKADVITGEKKEVLNKCLGFIAKLLIETTPDLASRPKHEEHMHYSYFIVKHQDLKTLFESCTKQEFRSAAEFLGRAELIEHNCTLLHGPDGDLTIASRKMLEICEQELNELALCENCYILSSTKPTKDWFSTPCDPPHKLVWAKQKGFEFWPAKVIQVTNEKLDVRFFGGHHERAWISLGLNNVESISVSPVELHIKKTKGWNKACNEMKEYIKQTQEVLGKSKADEILKFDINPHGVLEKFDSGFEQDLLAARGKKRKAEMRIYLAEVKKSKLQAPRTSKSARSMMLESSKQVNLFGQKAKLDEECARTWRFGTECIALFNNATKNEADLNAQAKPASGLVKKCNCAKRYSRKLMSYRAIVNKMRRQEKKKNIVISALYIRQYLKNYAVNLEKMENEITQLKAENEQLKKQLK